MTFRARPLETTKSRIQRAQESRKGPRLKGAVKGRTIGCTVDPLSGHVHLPGSILAQLSQGEDLSEGIYPHNLRYSKVSGRGRMNYLFIIDTSGSMVKDDRFAKVKGFIISLLESSYSRRVRVAVISYGGGRAKLEVPFTTSAELVAERISNLKGGGSTPLIPALEAAGKLIDRMRDEDLSIYILSDGRYDRHTTGHENWQISEFGNFCQARKIPVTLINAGRTNKTSIKRTTLLAAKLHASYHQLEDLRIAEINSRMLTAEKKQPYK
ncbi:MAG: VWA domain-containing protein [Mogibacterium sp.]|nr:VWA domain-containing protein [Mogibacterium sp.]